ncbi:MAG: fluoride efflux transporter CrcB [Acidimicrobiales bacterium]
MGHDDGDAHVVVPIDPDLAPGDPAAPSAAHLPTRRRRHGRAQPDVLAAIAAGGALGAPARYEMTRLIHATTGTFPWATFWTNITGSVALGFLLILIIERFPPSRYLRPFFATGFLGAYTTFSTYMVDTDTLIKDGHLAVGVAYLFASAAAGFAAVWAGIIAGRLVPVAQHRRDPQPKAHE